MTSDVGQGAGRHPHLFSELRLGHLTLKNRLVMLPMGARLSPDGIASDSDVAWLEERARGGVGLIIAGGQVVSPSAVVPASMDGHPGNVYRLVEAFRPEGVAAQRRRVDAVHAHGAAIIGQLVHQGRDNGFQSGLSTVAPVLSPSPIRTPGASDTPHELTTAEIRQIVTEFGDSATLLQEAGFDGAELHAAHGYLIAQFLSPLANARSDQYGLGTHENRVRFLMEIVAEIRRRCPGDFVLGVRLSADEEIPGGLDIEATKAIVATLEASGSVDYVSISRATRGNYVKDSSTPWGAARDSAAQVRAATSLPVIAASRITTPDLAEEILEDGEADLVGLGRALIADPLFALKASGEHPGAVRPCVGFVQDCRQSVGGILCGVNAGASRELEWSAFRDRRDGRRTLMVVGGGPGGLEAARVAAEQGDDVVLWERSDRLGGQLVTAARGPHRGELQGFVDYLTSEVKRLGVDIRLAATPTEDELRDADLVIAATGSLPVPASAPGFGGKVLSTWDLVADGIAQDPGTVVVVDDGSGFWPIASASEIAALAGADVHVVSPMPTVLHNIPPESQPNLHRRLRGAGVQYHPFHAVGEVGVDGVDLVDVLTGVATHLGVDCLVLQTSRTANDGGLLADRPNIVRIGDSVAPRRLSHAVLEANRAVRPGVPAPVGAS